MDGRDQPIPITDIIGIRVVCPFLGDLERAVKELASAFSVTEIERKGAERSFREFGYESIHLLVELPMELGAARPGLDVKVCEIQLRTILQEAWAEVEHELVYKNEFTPFDEPMKRKVGRSQCQPLPLGHHFSGNPRLSASPHGGNSLSDANDFYAKIEESIDRPFIKEREILISRTKDTEVLPPGKRGGERADVEER